MASVEKKITIVFDDDAPLPTGVSLLLAEGIVLEPIPAFLLESANEHRTAYLRPNFAQFARDHCHQTTLSLSFQGDSDLNDEGVAEEAVRSLLSHYVHAMMIERPALFGPHGFVTSVPSTDTVSNVRRLHSFGGILEESETQLTPADFQRIDGIYAGVRDVVSEDRPNRVSIASAMYHDALRVDIGLETRFVGLTTGLEALVSSSDREITHQLAERIAFLLRTSGVERLEMYKAVKRLYGVRSTIVHGNTVSKNWKRQRDALPDQFGELLELVRCMLTRILLDDSLRVFFRDADSERLDEGMKRLFLGALEGDD